jgi:hypothetical protein
VAIRTYGPNAVDWEQRVDLDRLRTERLARLRATLDASSLGSLLTFDFGNIRYLTSTHIGTWAMDKLIRFAVLPRGGEPVLWDFGSAARYHQLFNPWLDGEERARAGISTLRGAFHPDAGIAEEVARKVATVLREHDLADQPIGVDVADMPIPLRAQGRGARRRRRAAGLLRGAPRQDGRRDRAAHPGLLDGRRGLRGPLRGHFQLIHQH